MTDPKATYCEHLRLVQKMSVLAPDLVVFGGVAVALRTRSNRPWKMTEADVDTLSKSSHTDVVSTLFNPSRRKSERVFQPFTDPRWTTDYGDKVFVSDSSGRTAEIIFLGETSPGVRFVDPEYLPLLELTYCTAEPMEIDLPNQRRALPRFVRPPSASAVVLPVARTGSLLLTKLIPGRRDKRAAAVEDVKALIEAGAVDDAKEILSRHATPGLNKAAVKVLSDFYGALSTDMTLRVQPWAREIRGLGSQLAKLDKTVTSGFSATL